MMKNSTEGNLSYLLASYWVREKSGYGPITRLATVDFQSSYDIKNLKKKKKEHNIVWDFLGAKVHPQEICVY